MDPKRRSPVVLGLVLASVVGCGPLQPVNGDATPNPELIVPRLFDPAPIYRAMGLFAQGAPLPFVASARFLPGPDADSTLVVFGVSLANNALSFRRVAGGFEAGYRVEVVFQRAGRVVRRFAAEESVRVAGFRETLRADESVVFQQFITVPPDSYQVAVAVHDGHGTASQRDERLLDVPRLGGTRLGVVPAYTVAARRTTLAAPPALVANPRTSIPYGVDSLRLLVEAARPLDGPVRLLVRTAGDRIVHAADVALADSGPASAVVRIAPEALPVGELDLLLIAGDDTVRVPALVSFSDQWAITNFDEVLSLLRYFGREDEIRAMRDAPPEERPGLWRAFWRATDPNPVTPEHEALERYFQRVQEANRRFQEGGDPGWLTDRGEVFIALGEPDEMFEQSPDLQGTRRIIRWTYIRERLTLDFVDDTGFGRFRLTASSRAAFGQAVQRVRSQS